MIGLNFEPAALIQCLLCLVYCLTAKRKQYRLLQGLKRNLRNQHFIFLLLLISTILSSAASVGGAYLQKIASEKVAFWQYQLHAVYFFFHTMLSVCFAVYIMHINGSSGGRRPWFYALFFSPFLLSELLVLTNRFTGWVFYMDESFAYHRGPLILVLYVCGLFYLALAFVLFFRYKKAVSLADSRAIGALFGLSLLGVVIQGIYSNVLVELYAESLTFMGMLMVLETRSDYIEPVTGALTRVALVDDIRRLIESGQGFLFVFFRLTDIELFYKIFDSREIDSLLLRISGWLASISSGRKLYRYRSRAFGVLFSVEEAHEAATVAEAILQRFDQEWKAGEAALRLEVLVSTVSVPQDVSTLEGFMELLASADQKTGSGSRLVPCEELSAGRRDRQIEQALRDAVRQRRLRVWYQPIWSVEERRTVAAEALLRIDSDALRDISPEIYIPIAEKSGIIREIGLYVFEAVCRLLQDPRVQELGLSYIELNLSVYQFKFDDLVTRFEDIRSRYGIPPEALNLEITESASTGEAPMVEQTMEALRKLGYTFSLDDFGTGYSNLKQLISSSYKNVKMDKSLLWGAEYNESTARLLDSMIRVIRSLGYNVVQEGVETNAQLARTEASGGNLIQGYHFSRPLPDWEFIAYLEKERAPLKPAAS